MEDRAGERYLRLLLERILATGHQPDGPARIAHAGAALVAVGAVDREVVAELRDDLALCLALRRPAPDAAELAAAVAVPAGEVTGGEPGGAAPRAVATGPNRFETPEGVLRVESISFGPDGATIVETLDTGGADPAPGATRRGRAAGVGPAVAHDPMRPVTSRLPRPHRLRGEPGAPDHRSSGPASRATTPGVPPLRRPVGPGREQLRITDSRGQRYQRGPGESGSAPGGWRWVSPIHPVPGPETGWLEVALGDSPPARLGVTAARTVARGQPARRSPGASWLLGALEEAVAQALRSDAAPTTGAVTDGVDALLAVGRLQASEPLLQQVALLEGYPERAAELDPSLASPLAGRERRPSDRAATLPVACVVDLGTHAARLDVAAVGPNGLRLSGWFSPWPAAPDAGHPGSAGPDAGWRITGFDDRHNQYVATVDQLHRSPAGADVVWRLWPALDAAARSLRLRVAGPALEASVEIVVE